MFNFFSRPAVKSEVAPPPLRCAYLTFEPAEDDQNIWSGLNFNIRQALRLAGFSVEHLGGLLPAYPLAVRLKWRYYPQIFRRKFDPLRSRPLLEIAGRTTAQRLLDGGKYDFLFAPSSFPVACLPVNIPRFVWLDATFAPMIGYYYHGLCRETIRSGNEMEGESLRDCAGVFFASEWAAQGALRHYQLDEKRVHVVPFGANMESPFRDAAEARAAIQKRSAPPCEFLFLGVDWERKNGAHAIAVVEQLNARGLPARLTIAGCQPPLAAQKNPFVRLCGFLDKTKPGDLARLRELLAQSHFLILPTRAEAYGLVFAEAAAFAVPSLAVETGGVPTLVKTGSTGLLFPPGATAAQWAEKISGWLQTPGQYQSMALAAYEHYCRTLNWPVAARRVREIILKTLENRH